MRVIELNIDNVFYFSFGRVQRASILSLGDTGYGGQKRAEENECAVQIAEREKGFHKEPPGDAILRCDLIYDEVTFPRIAGARRGRVNAALNFHKT
jgi:hypothetical protein